MSQTNEAHIEANPWDDNVDQIIGDARSCKTVPALKSVEKDYLNLCGAWPKEVSDRVEGVLSECRKALAGEG